MRRTDAMTDECAAARDLCKKNVKMSQCLKRFVRKTLECGSIPNVMVALPSIGGAFCSTPESSAGAHYSAAAL